MSDLFPVTLVEMRATVRREVAYRERVYPRWVADKRMTQSKADHELRYMRGVLDLLERLDEKMLAEPT